MLAAIDEAESSLAEDQGVIGWETAKPRSLTGARFFYDQCYQKMTWGLGA
jgi:hypothetical protein